MSTKARKTVDVAFVVAKANTFLAAEGNDWSPTAEQRKGVASLLEVILMETGNYKGFGYLPSEFLPAEEQTNGRVLREGYDDTRRRYFNAQA